MAQTCSYKIDGDITRDYQCFAPFRNAIGKQVYIIIEEKKFCFTKSQIRTYLNDLKKMDKSFDFTYKFNRKKNQFELNVSNFTCKYKLITFAMAVRYLWEGYYKKYGRTDHFYKVVEHYFKLKELFPKENKLKLLCLACNCFLAGRNPINSNHFFCEIYGSYLKKDLNDLNNNSNTFDVINKFFTNNKLKINQLDYPDHAEDWSNEDYYELKEYIENNEK